jgi:hypothetical protein
MFLKHERSTISRLYGTLSHMSRLNLTTVDCEITLDFDYKHIFKCECLFHALLDTRLISNRMVHLTAYSQRHEAEVTAVFNGTKYERTWSCDGYDSCIAIAVYNYL